MAAFGDDDEARAGDAPRGQLCLLTLEKIQLPQQDEPWKFELLEMIDRQSFNLQPSRAESTTGDRPPSPSGERALDDQPMDDCASGLINPPRWNPWFRVSPVQFEGEEHPVPRGVRLCCPAARAGDPVQIIDGKRMISASLVRVECSILHVIRRND